uniref:G_PROTEIN_RECEP_F1_2 domain-containing protein n=1 Tax=Caenorhabditis japonica TaxID=281687 RepID=A0A8R1HNC1_CAEJA
MNATNSSTMTISPMSQTTLKIVMFLNSKVLLLQIIFGCGGNILNLIVLLSRAMRSRTNLIFAAMAFADLFFLILHIPSVLFFIGPIRDSAWYRNGFSQVIAGMLNWSSAVSIWYMMYATIERVQVFRSPFRTSKRSASTRFFLTLFAIAVICLLLTIIHFFHPRTRSANKYARYVVYLHMITVVIIPMLLSTTLNTLLVCALRKNSMPLRMLNDSHVHQSLIVQRTRTERKVTAMVTVILSSFIACNAPGAFVFVLKERDEKFDDKPLTTEYEELRIEEYQVANNITKKTWSYKKSSPLAKEVDEVEDSEKKDDDEDFQSISYDKISAISNVSSRSPSPLAHRLKQKRLEEREKLEKRQACLLRKGQGQGQSPSPGV